MPCTASLCCSLPETTPLHSRNLGVRTGSGTRSNQCPGRIFLIYRLSSLKQDEFEEYPKRPNTPSSTTTLKSKMYNRLPAGLSIRPDTE